MDVLNKWIVRSIPMHLCYFGLDADQQRAWNSFYRWLIPPKKRWFFEGNRNMWGQLWLADRKVLYDTVRRHKPNNVFEVGTWKGGGSTYFIAQALYENGGGVIHTIELDAELYEEAVRNYQVHASYLLPYVRFHRGRSTEVYPEILRQSGVDLLFLDGIGAEQTLSEFKLFELYFKKGGIVIAHDWNDEKTRLFRPYIEQSNDWVEVIVIHPPESVGLAVFARK